jgi:peptidoglycan/xylan/chitin deacetylase (PgdA/CDA1 family)
MSKRASVAKLLTSTGMISVLQRLATRPGILVLNHHRIGNRDECMYDRGVFGATAEEFERQLLILKSRFNLVGLEEFESLLQAPEKIRHFRTMLTFDDGCMDNYEVAFPILRAHNATATFFVTTSLVGTAYLPWWDRIAYCVRQCELPVLTLRYPHPAKYDLAHHREGAIRSILKSYKSEEMQDSEHFFAALAEQTRVSPPSEAPATYFFNWAQAREMRQGGMTFGSHTHSHTILSKLTFSQQCEELARSKAEIERNLGVSVRTLAYPVGARQAFSEETIRALRDTGYTAAFSFYGGVNQPKTLNPFDVLRMEPERNTAVFRMQLCSAGLLGRYWD